MLRWRGGTEPLRVRFVTGDNGYVQYDASMIPREFFEEGVARLMIVDIGESYRDEDSNTDEYDVYQEYVLNCGTNNYFSGFWMNNADTTSDPSQHIFENIQVVSIDDDTWHLTRTSYIVYEYVYA